MRRLGKSVHPLVSINYFAVSICIVTTIFSTSIPDLVWPTQVESWCLLAITGVLGLRMEWLLTAGLGSGNAAATIVIYSQVLWALIRDWFIWRFHVNISTVLGCMVVVASLIVPCLVRELFHPKKDISILSQSWKILDPRWIMILGTSA
jgi:drug/metabolite transporter (DMT)-like permease